MVEVYVSAISLLELELGVLLKERSDPTQGAMLRRWKDEVVSRKFAGRVLVVDQAVGETSARLHVPDPRPALDALIAATAITHGKTLVTRNIADFHGIPVRLIDPWALVAGR